jgi:hypothetical protein
MKTILLVVLLAVTAYIVLAVSLSRRPGIRVVSVSDSVGSNFVVHCGEFERLAKQNITNPVTRSHQDYLVLTITAKQHWGWAKWRPARLTQVCSAIVEAPKEK